MKLTLLRGYKAASDATGIPVKQLKRMVARRSIRVIKEKEKTVMFFLEHIQEDFMALETKKLI